MFRATIVAALLLLPALNSSAQETVTRGKNLSVDIAADGRVAIGLVGDIWIVPRSGGEASRATNGGPKASRPKWSPDALQIAFHSNANGAHSIWVYDLVAQRARKLSSDGSFDMQPAWHPDQERIVYARDKTGHGFDLWETDLPTGLHWRLTHRPGDETEPAWSADGRDLVFVHHEEERWSLVLRRQGQPDETLVSTTDRLSAPAWRPDDSLVTYLRDNGTATSIEMVILSEPRLVRTYADNEDFEEAPVSWLDRHAMIYAADGRIRQRLFNSWSSSPLLFRARLEAPARVAPVNNERRALPRIDEPPGRLIIHAGRLYDGLGSAYQPARDIVIDGGRITAVEAHRERPGELVIDMGDLVVMPGYVDARADLDNAVDEHFGPLLLTTGVTTLVADSLEAERLNTLWSSKELPGPRVLADNGQLSEESGAMADSMTPGLPGLLQSRQAGLIGVPASIPRRFAEQPSIAVGMTSMVLASRGNGLQPGLALQAELLALTAAGLKPVQALRAAGVNAAAALGVDPFLGRIAVGAVADLVFVDGDPLVEISDAARIVAVVRNGRFFSAAGLIDRAKVGKTVE